MKQLGKDSIRQMELMRFYLQHKQDPHGPNIALFIGNLPQALSQRNYETIITKYITEENKYSSIGPIYYEYGSVIITFENASKAVRTKFYGVYLFYCWNFCVFKRKMCREAEWLHEVLQGLLQLI